MSLISLFIDVKQTTYPAEMYMIPHLESKLVTCTQKTSNCSCSLYMMVVSFHLSLVVYILLVMIMAFSD